MSTTEPRTDSGNSLRARFAATSWIVRLAFATTPGVMTTIAIATLAIGVLPPIIAWVGRLVVDAVVVALGLGAVGWAEYKQHLWQLVFLEGSLATLLLLAHRALGAAQAMLRLRLAHRVTEKILDKALTLSLAHYEDPEIHDRLMRARRDAGTRPNSLVNGLFTLTRNLVTLVSCIVILASLSYWAVLLVVLSGLPVFAAELFFSQQSFDRQRKRSPDERAQAHLEAILSREDYAKEVKLYDLGERLMARFRRTSRVLEDEERVVVVRRNIWGFLLNAVGTAAFYLAYAWVVHRTVNEHHSLGELTMYVAIFRQAQQGVTTGLASLGAMLDDHLYLRDLQAFLAMQVSTTTGTATEGPDPEAGLVVEDLSFTYTDARRPALDRVSFTVRPGEMVALVGQNGSGKTTLLKLITRLYEPTSGRILVDGLDIRAWEPRALRRRFALVFQDFVRFKMTAGENIGAGDTEHWDDEERWVRAAQRGLAHSFLSELPDGYHSQLGKWFRGGQELSGGQWQKVALSRAFMREEGQIMILDEPTAALDPEAERDIFAHVKEIRGRQSVLLISHRFGSVRESDSILVLDHGHIVENGTHDELVRGRGLYARLFELSAQGYADDTGVDGGGAEERSGRQRAVEG